MSLLKLTNKIEFAPLIKLSKKQLAFVEDDWHHATLTYNDLTPSHDHRYNDLDYDDHTILAIILKYGVRTPIWMGFNNELTDDEFYKFVFDNISDKNFTMDAYIVRQY